MKEVLYIAPYRQKDEWGKNSVAFLNHLLNDNEIELITRPVWFNNDNNYYDELPIINECELKYINNRDIIIQYGLPNNLIYNGDFKKNIAITHVDCNIANMGWKDNLNLFDRVIVFSKFEKDLLIESGVTSDIYNFDYPPIYLNDKDINNIYNIKHLENNFIFFSFASLDKKSGYEELISAYISAFDTLDNVILIIASDDQGMENKIEQIKSNINKYKLREYYPNIAIINTKDLDVINYIYKTSDCFIDSSYNSRISQNILNAIYYSKPIIMIDSGNMDKDYPLFIEHNNNIINYDYRPIEGLYSGEFSWKVPSTIHLKSLMIKVFNNTDQIKDIATQKILKKKLNINNNIKIHIKESLCI